MYWALDDNCVIAAKVGRRVPRRRNRHKTDVRWIGIAARWGHRALPALVPFAPLCALFVAPQSILAAERAQGGRKMRRTAKWGYAPKCAPSTMHNAPSTMHQAPDTMHQAPLFAVAPWFFTSINMHPRRFYRPEGPYRSAATFAFLLPIARRGRRRGCARSCGSCGRRSAARRPRRPGF